MESYSIKPGYRSDHSIVTTELKFNTFKRGRGLWKFNNSLLSDMNYVQKVKETIQDICKQYLVRDTEDIDDSSFLDVLLMEIRGNMFYGATVGASAAGDQKMNYDKPI